jgi:Ni/Fe-hydrogenase subunit HybB-like protein
VFLSIAWAVSLHLVTAFLYAGLPARPYWHAALLGPRFLATAFAAGPALMILILALIRRRTEYRIPDARYSPTWVELTVTAGLWALGAFVFTVLAKAAIPVELGRSRWRAPAGPRG